MTDRRARFGVAAVTVISKSGLRALTHRSVDEEAGLPAGSVNYYAPTRSKLLQLALDSVHQQMYDIFVDIYQPLIGLTGEALYQGLVDRSVVLVNRLSTTDNGLVVARRALIVEAHFDHALAESALGHRQRFIDFAAPIVEAAHPGARAPEIIDLAVALLNGIVEQQSMIPTSDYSEAMLRDVVSRVLTPIDARVA